MLKGGIKGPLRNITGVDDFEIGAPDLAKTWKGREIKICQKPEGEGASIFAKKIRYKFYLFNILKYSDKYKKHFK